MKKSILELGKALNKADQKEINGGCRPERCTQEGSRCCTDTGRGLFCAPGRCKPTGCMWF